MQRNLRRLGVSVALTAAAYGSYRLVCRYFYRRRAAKSPQIAAEGGELSEISSISDMSDLTITCGYCGGYGHILKYCPPYQIKRNSVTKVPYFSAKLHENDLEGFAAAGVLPFTFLAGKIHVLLIREERPVSNNPEDGVKTRFNYIGGKRESIIVSNEKYTIERPKQTAVRELDEECKEVNIPLNLHLSIKRALLKRNTIFWASSSKTAIYILDVPNGYIPEESDKWKWVPLDELTSENTHAFALKSILTCGDRFAADQGVR